MTYCVSMRLDAGLVFLSDSRTNAGVDHINTFRKMHVFEKEGERVLVLMTSGNLSISQSVVNTLREKLESSRGSNLNKVKNMFEAAKHIGTACVRFIPAMPLHWRILASISPLQSFLADRSRVRSSGSFRSTRRATLLKQRAIPRISRSANRNTANRSSTA